MPPATIVQQWPQRDFDHTGFVGDEAAHRVGAEVPALGQFADGVVLIEGNAGSFELHRSPYVPDGNLVFPGGMRAEVDPSPASSLKTIGNANSSN